MSEGRVDEEAQLGYPHPGYRSELGLRIADLVAGFTTKKAAANAAGVSADQLNNYIEGRSKVPFEVVLRLASVRGASLDWIATGAGSMEEDSARPAAGLDESLLADTIAEIDGFLANRALTIDPMKKAELISTVYGVILTERERGMTDVRATVTRIARLIA